MTQRLSVQYGTDVAFVFDPLDARLAAPLTDLLSHYRLERVAPGAFVIASTTPGLPANAECITEREGVKAYRSGDTTFLAAPGVTGWFNTASGEAGLASVPGESAAVYHVCSIALTIIFELALLKGWIGLHAAAVARNGRGLLLPGDSGCGKTTTYRNAAAAGFDTLSDDLVWAVPDGDDGYSLRPMPRGSLDAALPAPSLRSARLAAVVYPAIADRAHSRLQPVEAATMVQTLARQSAFVSTPEQTARRFRALLKLASSAQHYRLLAGRDPAEVPELLGKLLEQP